MADRLSDSDETKGSDSDVTLSPDTRDRLNQSPDLFAEMKNDKNKKGYRNTTSVPHTDFKKRLSKAHDISDSESEDDSNHVSASSRKPGKQSVNKHGNSAARKVTHSDKTLNKTEKRDTNKLHVPRSSEKPGRKEFLDSFLNMFDSSTDDEKEEKSVKHKHASPQVSLVQKPYKKDYSKPMVEQSAASRQKSEKNNSSEKFRHKEKNGTNSRSSPVLLKRKHSKSPVPQELRKAVTEILSADENTSARKKLPRCKYGSMCYRKNPSHFEEFSHETASKVEKRTSSSPPPKKKLKTVTSSPQPGSSRAHSQSQSPPRSSKTSLPPPKCVSDKFSQAQPYSFFLTKVSGIADKYNGSHAMDIKDILSPEMGNLASSCQFNFMFDISWLMKQYPSQFRSKPLLIVHGENGPSKNALQAQAMTFSNIKFCQARLEMIYGTHHTKMMLLLYDTGMRVVIHTSNLIQQDWHQKTQGMWISPVFPKLPVPSKEKGDSPTNFKRDLLAYLTAYKAYQLKEWIENIEKHDMSTSRVVIIASAPGRHAGDQAKSCWGHLKLRKVLKQHGPSQDTVKSWPVIGQFSSIGSMGPNKDSWVCGEFLQSLSATKSGTGIQNNARLQLVFPSKDNVRLCLEGFPAGGSIPYSVNTAKKQTYLYEFFHIWKSDGRGRSKAMPHIKTYVRPKQDGSKAAWFIVTSANLSKAAWGALEKKGVQLMIRSYEIGVLMLPKFFADSEVFSVTTDMDQARVSKSFPLPYDLPVQSYDKKDRPWMWDIPYMDLPDTNGNVWCPFSK